MRSQIIQVGATIKEWMQPNAKRNFLQFRNEDAANTAYFQTGESPGIVDNFFAIKPGEVFTYDPSMGMQAMVQGAWWLYSPNGTVNIKYIAG